MDNYQVFISYRRAGGEHLAGRIADRLKSLGYAVFLDVNSMKAGKFDEQILRAIEACEDILVVLSEHALDRCQNEGDYVRIEIEHALSLNKNVIPVMVPSFQFPELLPPKMNALRYCEGVIHSSNYFDAVVDRIESLFKSERASQNTSAALSDGVRFLKMGLYPQALACCEKAILEAVPNPDAYFYAAAALLSGKRPFLVDRATVQRAIDYLNAAAAVADKAIYHYFLAYLKLDYFSRKMLRTVPDYRYELQQALKLGISSEDMKSLFALLRTSKPDEL